MTFTRYLLMFVSIVCMCSIFGDTVFKNVDDHEHKESRKANIEVDSTGDTTIADDLDLESEIEELIAQVLPKQCPREEDDSFEGSEQDFMDLLMSTKLVKTAKVTTTISDLYMKFYVQSEGIVKKWNSFLTVISLEDEDINCMITCVFTPEEQLKMAKRYLFVNEWNKERLFSPSLSVDDEGDITLRKAFIIKKKWKWGIVYDVFSMSVEGFLDVINSFRAELRQQEDLAKLP